MTRMCVCVFVRVTLQPFPSGSSKLVFASLCLGSSVGERPWQAKLQGSVTFKHF